MIFVLQTPENKHLGFILFSDTDSNCIFQILPKEPEIFETEIYKKLIEYSADMERPFEVSNSHIKITGIDKPDIIIDINETIGLLKFNDDSNIQIPVIINKS